MKNLRLIAALVMLLFMPVISNADANGKLVFVAHLTRQDFPVPVQTNGHGMAVLVLNQTLDTMWVSATYHNLASTFEGAHVHVGGRGDQGPTLIDLTNFKVGPNALSIVVTDSTKLTAGNIGLLLSGQFYFNVHTLEHENGEIRGQFLLEGERSLGTMMTGLQEVPPVQTSAMGFVTMHLTHDKSKLYVHALAQGLSSAATMAHFHRGDTGVAGGVMVGLKLTGNSIHDTISMDDFGGSQAAYMNFIDSLMNGHVYLNIHSQTYPLGEIRGQIAIDTSEINFTTMLSGDQETPAVQTNAHGFGTVTFNSTIDTMWYSFAYEGLSSSITAAHFHKGAIGIQGPPVIPIPNENITANSIRGFISGDQLSKEFLRDLVSGNIYFNVHTQNNQGGEIRGQIMTNARETYTFRLTPDQEKQAVPVVSTASGLGVISFDKEMTSAHFMISAGSFVAPVVGAHFHKGKMGENGPVIFDILDNRDTTMHDSLYAGYWTSNSDVTGDKMVFSPEVVRMMRKDSIYANIHTSLYPQGEIRGQITGSLMITSVEEEISTPLTNSIVYPNPTFSNAKVLFESAQSGAAVITVSDMLGAFVAKTSVEITSGANSFDIDLANLSAGSYIVKIQSGEKILFTQKIVKK